MSRDYSSRINAYHEDLGCVILGLTGGTAAGTAWYTVMILHCPANESIVGKELCAEVMLYMPDVEWCQYRACNEWSDGFVSNADINREDLSYYSDGRGPGEGTPMGGEIVPELDGLMFAVTKEMFDEHNNGDWHTDDEPDGPPLHWHELTDKTDGSQVSPR